MAEALLQTELSPAPIARERIAQAFGAAAPSYDTYAALQREVATTLCAIVSPKTAPSVIVDLGCGTGYCSAQLSARFPDASLYVLDLAEPMLQHARRAHALSSLVCGDFEALPFASHSVDLACSSLVLQWSVEPQRVFAEVARVLRHGGTAAFSTFGPQSLRELRAAWAQVDPHTHVNHFCAESVLLRAAENAGLSARSERQIHTRWYRDLRELSRELKGIGAHNMNTTQRRGLTSREAFTRAEQAFGSGEVVGKGVPVTYEILYLTLESPE